MFESDDFDEALSQFDIFELSRNINSTKDSKDTDCNSHNSILPITLHEQHCESPLEIKDLQQYKSTKNVPTASPNPNNLKEKITNIISRTTSPKKVLDSPKSTKRKSIKSFFDTAVKRKFPGPAGLLSGNIDENIDDNICEVELQSQDVDLSENYLHRDVFESPLWDRLTNDLREWHLCEVDKINTLKQQALAGKHRWRKAQLIAAFVEAIDRSATDPVLILRDKTGNIKCTLHRDAWQQFSNYLASECCAIVLHKPTILTTGGAYKKHYLNITMSNLYAIYSSAVIDEDNMPDGYSKIYEQDFTVIKTERSTNQDFLSANSSGNDNLLDGLDTSVFLDEIF